MNVIYLQHDISAIRHDLKSSFHHALLVAHRFWNTWAIAISSQLTPENVIEKNLFERTLVYQWIQVIWGRMWTATNKQKIKQNENKTKRYGNKPLTSKYWWDFVQLSRKTSDRTAYNLAFLFFSNSFTYCKALRAHRHEHNWISMMTFSPLSTVSLLWSHYQNISTRIISATTCCQEKEEERIKWNEYKK